MITLFPAIMENRIVLQDCHPLEKASCSLLRLEESSNVKTLLRPFALCPASRYHFPARSPREPGSSSGSNTSTPPPSLSNPAFGQCLKGNRNGPCLIGGRGSTILRMLAHGGCSKRPKRSCRGAQAPRKGIHVLNSSLAFQRCVPQTLQVRETALKMSLKLHLTMPQHGHFEFSHES